MTPGRQVECCQLTAILPNRPRCNRRWRYLLVTVRTLRADRASYNVCGTHLTAALAKLTTDQSVTVTRWPL